MRKLLLAITFLTRLPFPVPKNVRREEIGSSTPFFPLVGLLIGAILVLVDYITSHFWHPFVVNVVIIISLITLTGGIHLDGLMDTCDGIFSGKDRERILEIMRDSHVGAFGVLGAICIISLKLAFLSSISDEERLASLLIFPMMGRWGMVYALTNFPYARTTSGLGSLFVTQAKRHYVIWATLQVLIVSVPLLLWKAFPVIIIVGFITWIISSQFSRKLGGLTGDTYGAICEFIETLSLAVISIKYI